MRLRGARQASGGDLIVKKLFVAVGGGTVLLLGVAMLVLPGPGLPVVAAGVAILATEFLWARRAWRKARGKIAVVRRRSGLRDWLRRGRRPWAVR